MHEYCHDVWSILGASSLRMLFPLSHSTALKTVFGIRFNRFCFIISLCTDKLKLSHNQHVSYSKVPFVAISSDPCRHIRFEVTIISQVFI